MNVGALVLIFTPSEWTTGPSVPSESTALTETKYVVSFSSGKPCRIAVVSSID